MKRYIKPVMDIHTMSLADVMLIGASNEGQQVIGDGGGTGNGGITEGGAKRRRGIFDDGEDVSNGIW